MFLNFASKQLQGPANRYSQTRILVTTGLKREYIRRRSAGGTPGLAAVWKCPEQEISHYDSTRKLHGLFLRKPGKVAYLVITDSEAFKGQKHNWWEGQLR